MPIISMTPETSDHIEYVPFNVSYAITYDELALNPSILNVTVTSSDGNDYSKFLTITVINGYSFTVSGTLEDVFGREMHYLDKDEKQLFVRRWKDVPKDYLAIFKYKGATNNSITLTVTVITSEGNITSSIIVANDWEASNANLVKYVNEGKY